MELKYRGVARFGFKFGSQIAAVFQQLNSRERGAKADAEEAPMPGLAQG